MQATNSMYCTGFGREMEEELISIVTCIQSLFAHNLARHCIVCLYAIQINPLIDYAKNSSISVANTNTSTTKAESSVSNLIQKSHPISLIDSVKH